MKYVVIAIALALSTTSAYFSVYGMKEIFPKYQAEIIVLTILLELAKITTAVYLHQNWEKVTGLIKLYLAAAAIALAVITSLGVYSFLMKSHVDQTISINNGALKESSLNKIEIGKLESEIKGYETRIDTLIKATNKKIDVAKKASEIDLVGSDEESKIRELQKKKSDIENNLAQMKGKNLDIESQILNEASIFNDLWFRVLVVLLVLTLDPLALTLLMSATSLDTEVKKAVRPKPKVKKKLEVAKKKPVIKKKRMSKKPKVITISKKYVAGRGRPRKDSKSVRFNSKARVKIK